MATTEREKRRSQQAPRVRGEIYTNITIGERIRYMREVRGMAQIELAEKCDLTQAAVSNLETDTTRKPSAPSLLRLASALDANPDWILSGLGHPDAVVVTGAAETELVRCYRKADADAKAKIIALARASCGDD